MLIVAHSPQAVATKGGATLNASADHILQLRAPQLAVRSTNTSILAKNSNPALNAETRRKMIFAKL